MLIATWNSRKLPHRILAYASSTAGQILQWLWPVSDNACRLAAAMLAAAALLGGFLAAGVARAGLTASEVAVVVNAGSLNSRTLANHYVALRGIPATNVVVLEGVPNSEVVSVADFRDKILRPLLGELERRRIRGHIQCIAYSADFPTAIDVSADLQAVQGLPQLFTPVGSLNGLTYLYAQVLANEPGYISLHSNFYARRPLEAYFANPGGSVSQADWTQIQGHISAGEHAQAADGLEEMFKAFPHQFPVAYLAAVQAMQGGDKPRALRLLQQAVAAGWSAADFVKNDKRLDPLRDEAEFQVLELLLDENIKELQPAAGFDILQTWAPNGVPADEPRFGLRYLLSTVLGVTRGAGSNLPEAIDVLERAASADFSHPQGGFYFALTDDVRTTTRQWGFIGAVDDLQALGFEAEIIDQPLPLRKPRVLGAQLGTPSFDWANSSSQFVPGAIADNLTSLGGVMTPGAGQTNLSRLLVAGAAGSSGAVTEPYALQEKFPHPNMYVVYARGASLAEAFYCSVTGPYQLLIVGDPLCQPFSFAPQVKLETELRRLQPGQPLELQFVDPGIPLEEWSASPQPVARRTTPLAASQMRLTLDGRDLRQIPMREQLKVALQQIPAGYHEIQLQFVADGAWRMRRAETLPVWIGPSDAITLTLPDAQPDAELDRKVSLRDERLVVEVQAAAGERVSLLHDVEQLAAAGARQSRFDIPLASLGMGPVRLQAQVELSDGTRINSLPLWLRVLP